MFTSVQTGQSEETDESQVTSHQLDYVSQLWSPSNGCRSMSNRLTQNIEKKYFSSHPHIKMMFHIVIVCTEGMLEHLNVEMSSS